MELDERLMIGYWFTDITAYSFSIQYKRILLGWRSSTQIYDITKIR